GARFRFSDTVLALRHPVDQCKLRNRLASKVHDISLQMRHLVYAPTCASLDPWRSRCKSRGLRENAGRKRKTFLFLALEPREAKPFTRFESKRGSHVKPRKLSGTWLCTLHPSQPHSTVPRFG